MAQSELPDEIIIIDDGSSPPVSLEGLSRPTSIRIELVRHDMPRGASAARNLGIRHAISQYVAFLDDDDEFLPEKIACLRDFLRSTPVDIVHHGARIVYDNEGISYETRVHSGFDFDDLLVRNLVGGTPVGCVKRESILAIGGFDESLPALQDWDTWLRAAHKGAHFGAIDAPLTICHSSTGQPGITMSLDNVRKALALIDAKFADELARLPPRQRRLRHRTDATRLAYRYSLTGQRLAAAGAFLRGAVAGRSPSLLVAATLSLLGFRYLAKARQHTS